MTLAKIGFALGYDPSMAVREMAGIAHQAELKGFDMAFFSEALVSNRDSITALAAFGLATTRILLGATQVVRLRTPLLMAQSVASLDELTGGRIVLAPGACTKQHSDRHGLSPIPPAGALREWVVSIRLLLTGRKITYEGQYVKLKEIGLNWTPLRSAIPLWVAAISRTGLRFAGQFGDGVILDAHTSPEYAANAIRIVKDAVQEAGRDWSTFEVAQLIACSVEDDRDRAVAVARREAASRFQSPQFPTYLRRRLRVGEPAIHPNDFPGLLEMLDKRGPSAIPEALSDAYVEATTASGTAEDVVERVGRYRQAGVTLPLLRPQARHQINRVLDLFAKR